jgi:drug/metabolite transporter (DMT)-like permease
MRPLRYPSSGFLLVAIGAALWGTDALFRRSLALDLPASTVVFWEHLILVLMTFPLLVKFARNMPSLDRWDVTAILFMGVGASAVATILFTQAFTYGDPTTPLLIQKLQPVIVILAAHLLLSERLLPRYGLYFGFAVGGAYLISFSDPTNVRIDEIAPALLAAGAAILWAMGTVVGRHLTAKIVPSQLTAIRFAVGLPAAAIILVVQGEGAAATNVEGSDIAALFALALIPGLAALVVYYKGLSRTYASSATLAELAFPLTAILIGWSVFDAVPTASQWVGIAILTATITVMSLSARDDPDALGVRSLETASRPERSKSAA